MSIELSENSKRIKVTYESTQEMKIIRPVTWKQLDNLIEYQKVILEEFLIARGALGTLLRPSNKRFWSSVEKICEMLETENKEKLNIDLIEDSLEIQKLFITANEEVDLVEGWTIPSENRYKPSFVSVIHGLDFYQILSETIQKLQPQK